MDAVQRGSGGAREILVKPAVDFSSLEAVLVVLSPPPAVEPDTETSGSGVESSTPAGAAAATKRSPDTANPPPVAIAPKPVPPPRGAAPQVPEPTLADPPNGNEER